MNKYIVEVIGTYFLVLAIGLTGNPIAIGCMLMAMIYMGFHISGAHFNPAVTLAIWVRIKIGPKDAIIYMICQLVGAVLAGLTILWVVGSSFTIAPTETDSFKVVMLELLFTFALATVILYAATNPKTEGNSWYGLTIGFTVLAGTYAIGPITGGAMNPAVGIGPNLVHAINGGEMGPILLYLAGPLGGGIIAGLAYRLMNPEEFSS